MLRNLILAGLPARERLVIANRLSEVMFKREETIFAAGSPMNVVVFPETCVVSLSIELPEGREIECAAVGYEGLVGYGGSQAHQVSHSHQKVQVAGTGFKMTATDLRTCCESCPEFARRTKRFHDALFALSLQSTACVSAHNVDERLARWLLEMIDRTASNELPFTHEVLAAMIGATRTTVTLALRSFERAGLVEMGRGTIVIPDRAALEAAVCSCYGSTRKIYSSIGLAA